MILTRDLQKQAFHQLHNDEWWQQRVTEIWTKDQVYQHPHPASV